MRGKELDLGKLEKDYEEWIFAGVSMQLPPLLSIVHRLENAGRLLNAMPGLIQRAQDAEKEVAELRGLVNYRTRREMPGG